MGSGDRPEETCPHCYNELGDYRVLSLDQLAPGEQEEQPKRGRTGRALDDEFMDLDGEEEVLETDPYDSAAQSLTDSRRKRRNAPTAGNLCFTRENCRQAKASLRPPFPPCLASRCFRPRLECRCMSVRAVLEWIICCPKGHGSL